MRFLILIALGISSFACVLCAQRAEPPPEDPNFSVLLGIGSLIINPNATNYEIKDNKVLQAHNLGAATPQLMTGLSFTLPFGKPRRWRSGDQASPHPHPWYSFVSLKFSPGSPDALDGYVIGASYRLGAYFDILAGYSLSPVHEPSPGFQAVAVQAVTQHPDVSAYQPFVGKNTDLLANRKNAFDGFPILQQTGSSPGTLFLGDPLITHYRGGFIIGVAFPIKLRASFGGGDGTGTPSPRPPTRATSSH
jgi:hypothetical protein